LSANNRLSPIVGDGEMARRIRAHDWGASTLGPMEEWSSTLLTHVNLVLCAPDPAALYWGSQLTFLYNDATIAVLREKHPALGRSFREVRRGAWFQIGADFEACLRSGVAVSRENIALKGFALDEEAARYFSYFLIPVIDQGTVSGIHGSFRDVTEKMVRETKQATELAALEALFEQAPATIALLKGPEHVYEMVNPAHDDLVGGVKCAGKRVCDVLPEAVEQGFVAKLDEVYRTGVPYRAVNARLMLRASATRPAREVYTDFVYQPRREADGTVCGIIALGVDVTERRRAEHALVQNEKLAAVGRLSTSIAHEINNPLTSVMNYLFLAGLSSDVEEIRGYLAIMDSEIRRVSEISHQTLASQRASTRFAPVVFPSLAEGVLSLYAGRIKEARVAVESKHREGRALPCLEGEIRQLLGNLVSNAIDAMSPTGGRLLVRSREGTDWGTGRSVYRVTVADTGVGIPKGDVDEIFKPFYSTKGEAGNGLGLWITREILAHHHGGVKVRTSQKMEHRGTVFSLTLPA
jgi:signal transduction histidine kinase